MNYFPKMAIIDADMHMNQPKGLTASGIDALTHALEAYASIMATEYTDGLALQAMKNIFEYLPAAYELGAHDAVAREKMATASTMAGMAFANAFLGVCHSLAHKLGAYHHLPHGIANALLITDVMRFNALQRFQPRWEHSHSTSIHIAKHVMLSVLTSLEFRVKMMMRNLKTSSRLLKN